MLNRIYTIGHSTRSLAELVALLGEHDVTRLADIRRFPGSRRHPHFSKESLEHSLPGHGIAYVHFEDLGGRRQPAERSPNGYWENDQFRGYADWMAEPAFQAAIGRLLGDEHPTAVMCAEAVPWRCHRQLLADDLVRRGVEVLHILGPNSSKAHTLSSFARVEADGVVYPPEQGAMF